MTRKVTRMEQRMYERGYASSRMAAVKLRKHYKSVLRQVRLGQLRSVKVGHQSFIEINSIREYYAEAEVHLGLNDWSDVFYTDSHGDLYVRSYDV